MSVANPDLAATLLLVCWEADRKRLAAELARKGWDTLSPDGCQAHGTDPATLAGAVRCHGLGPMGEAERIVMARGDRPRWNGTDRVPVRPQ